MHIIYIYIVAIICALFCTYAHCIICEVTTLLIRHIIDLVHVIAYNYHGSWDGETGHTAPLYPDRRATDKSTNVVCIIASYLHIIINAFKRPILWLMEISIVSMYYSFLLSYY